MEKTYGRILSDSNHVDFFLRNSLHLDQLCNKKDYLKYVSEITSAAMQKTDGQDTLTKKSFRLPPYVDDVARVELRETIYTELIKKKRLVDDEKITLGRGGALPRTKCIKEKNAFYIIGLPASGKSEVSNILSDEFGAIILDSDFAKRKFPEYAAPFSASVLHEESSIVTFGGKGEFAQEPSVLQYAVQGGYNIVIPKIGDVLSKVTDFSNALVKGGYRVHLVLVRLDREKATQRAVFRFIKTKRYVPLQLIFDVYGNDPTITFFDLMLQDQAPFKSYTLISSDVPKGTPKKLMFASENSPITQEILMKGVN